MEDKIVEAFNFGVLQDCSNLNQILVDNGISWKEFIEWLEEKKKESVSLKNMRDCPNCNGPLNLSTVNKDPGLMVGDDYNSLWSCPDSDCGYEDYSEKTYQEQLQRLIPKGK